MRNLEASLSQGMRRSSRVVTRSDYFYQIVALVVLFASFSFLSPIFLTGLNLADILVQAAIVVPSALGMTMVIITGGIDLSVASNLTLTGVFAALLMVRGVPVLAAVLLGLVLGLVIGLFNGYFSAFVGIPSFMVTLAMQFIARGAALSVTKGDPVAGLPVAFGVFGLGDAVPVLLALGLLVVVYYVMAETRLGRHIYADGGNPEAAQLYGLPIRREKLIAFVICGVLTSVSGIVLTSRLMTASPVVAYGWELTVITAVVLGGTSLLGGRGNCVGTAVGALIIAVLNTGLSVMRVSPFYAQLISGILIFGIILLDWFRSRTRQRGAIGASHEDI